MATNDFLEKPREELDTHLYYNKDSAFYKPARASHRFSRTAAAEQYTEAQLEDHPQQPAMTASAAGSTRHSPKANNK